MGYIRLRYKLPIILIFSLSLVGSYTCWPVFQLRVKAETSVTTNNVPLRLKFSRPVGYRVEADVMSALSEPADSSVIAKQSKINAFYSKLKPEVDARRRKRVEIYKLLNFLKSQGSPIATFEFADMIITLSEAQGADYRVVVAIMGIESGFCTAPYMKYNCFGYLNGKQYDSFNHAMSRLVPAVAAQYARVYGTNFEGLAQAYGMINWTYHAPRMRAFYSALL